VERRGDDDDTDLPPGQHAIDAFPRWGLPRFVRWKPAIPEAPRLLLGGDVRNPHAIGLHALDAVPRREQVSDLHCVTTWTRRGLRWSGWAFGDVYRQVVARAAPEDGVRFVVFRGLDDYWIQLPLDDALAGDVLLADRVDGRPLSAKHGAPLRLVAPAHYAYKSAKHLCAIELRREPATPATQDWREHSRGRVALEERGSVLPGRVFRVVYRTFLPLMMRAYLGPAARSAAAEKRAGTP
jgi:DMSO/TMAO reductase YedYZ molybdopterin-dependent catalytic subunit